MMDLDWNIFAFLSWLELNKEAHTLDGLTINDGYDWYNEQWKCWLKNSDAGKQVQLTHNGEVTWWGGNPGMNNTVTTMSPTDLDNERFFKTEASDYNPAVREKYQPERYNPNKPALDTMTFKFEQEENCVDGGEGETLIVEAKSSLGIDGDGGAFYVLRTEQWAISDISDMVRTLERVKAALDATKPTSVHVK